MTDMASSEKGILAQLKALNRTWCVDGGINRKDGLTTADIDTSVDTVPIIINGTNQHKLDYKKNQTTPLTPLEKARIAISKLPPATSSVATTTTNDLIVPYLFYALKETENNDKHVKEEKHLTPSSQTPPADTNKNSTHEYELRQIEWHVVLILELWSCASQSTTNGGFFSKPMVLNALANSILLYRDQLRQKNRKTNKKKKKKDPKASAIIMPEKEKETLLLDHLVQILSRVPFLLPRDVPLSQFLNDRILTSDRLFWERLHHFVSHIFETFEISNPYRSKPNGDKGNGGIIDRALLLASVSDQKNDDSPQYPMPEGKKKYADETTTAKKRKPSREKLQAIAKNKKRQRLASLTSKKKNRGSHFHRNLDDISKLLEKKKTKTTLLANTRGKTVIANSDDGTIATLRERKASGNKLKTNSRHPRAEKVDPSGRKKMGLQNKNKSHMNIEDSSNRGIAETNVKRDKVIKYRDQSKRPFKPKDFLQQATIEELSTDANESIPYNKRKNTNHNSNGNYSNNGDNNRSSNTEVLPMTPQKTARPDTSLIIGETPVPTNSVTRFETVVGETPVPGNGSRMLEMIAGETPTYDNYLGSTPMSSSTENPFFSPPVLPSPSKLSAGSLVEDNSFPSKHPVKLFGTVRLLKRTNGTGSRGQMKNWDGNVQGRVANKNAAKEPSMDGKKIGGKSKAGGSSSIDKARAFLRSKTS